MPREACHLLASVGARGGKSPSNSDEWRRQWRRQRSRRGDAAAAGWRSQGRGREGLVGSRGLSLGCFRGGISNIRPGPPLRLGDTKSPTAMAGPAWVAPGLLCVTPEGFLPGSPYATHPPSKGDRSGGRGGAATPCHQSLQLARSLSRTPAGRHV